MDCADASRRKAASRCLKKRFIIRVNGDDYLVDARVVNEGVDRMRDHRPPSDQAVLFRPVRGPGAFAAARRHNDNGRLS